MNRKGVGRKSAKNSGVDPSRVNGAPTSGSTARLELFFPIAIFVLVFSVRFLYLVQIEAMPLFYHPGGDGRSYDEWAQGIAAGDWLGKGVFYQAPLYPYFLGILQFVLGHDLWAVRLVQISVGAFSCVLVYWAGRSYFSRAAGIAAALILTLYAPGIFFEALIQKAVLDLFLISLLLLTVSRLDLKPERKFLAVAGMIVGLLALSRENALIWAVVVPAWIWLRFSAHSAESRLGWIAVFLLSVMLVLLPVGLRNLRVGGEFALTTSQLGPNLFIGNNEQANGTYMALRAGHGDPRFERRDATELAEQASGRALSPGEVSDYWVRRSWNYIRTEPLDWLRLMVRKWFMLWNFREFEDTDDFYLYQRWSGVLAALGYINHFGILTPLAALGMILTWTQWRRLVLLYALLGSLALSIVVFYILGRYRVSLVPLLVLFAGAGLTEGFKLYRARDIRQAKAGFGVLLVAMTVNWPIFGWPGPSAAGYHNVGNALFEEGKIERAIESYQQALKILPTYASAHYSLGNSFARLGRFNEAVFHYEEAIGLNPEFTEAYNNIGNVLALRGELDGAIQQFRKALDVNPDSSEVHLNLGTALARRGQLNEAIGQFQQALKITPNSVRLRYTLGTALAAQGRLREAADQFRDALRLQPDFAPARENLRELLAQQERQKR